MDLNTTQAEQFSVCKLIWYTRLSSHYVTVDESKSHRSEEDLDIYVQQCWEIIIWTDQQISYISKVSHDEELWTVNDPLTVLQ